MDGRPILLVDDELAICDAIAFALVSEGYQVEVAHNGLEALQAIETQRPSLVVLDMHMPVLDGWGFTKAIRERGFDPPILVITATARSAKQAAEEIGADGYCPKPFPLNEFLHSVEVLRIP
jgi:two-component system response regulator MprA